jgi:hypothetical protein
MYRRFLLKLAATRLYLTGATIREVDTQLRLTGGLAQRLIPQSVTRRRGPRRAEA